MKPHWLTCPWRRSLCFQDWQRLFLSLCRPLVAIFLLSLRLNWQHPPEGINLSLSPWPLSRPHELGQGPFGRCHQMTSQEYHSHRKTPPIQPPVVTSKKLNVACRGKNVLHALHCWKNSHGFTSWYSGTDCFSVLYSRSLKAIKTRPFLLYLLVLFCLLLYTYYFQALTSAALVLLSSVLRRSDTA